MVVRFLTVVQVVLLADNARKAVPLDNSPVVVVQCTPPAPSPVAALPEQLVPASASNVLVSVRVPVSAVHAPEWVVLRD